MNTKEFLAFCILVILLACFHKGPKAKNELAKTTENSVQQISTKIE
jgi:hypothetical protein